MIDSNLIAYYKNEIEKKNEYIYFDKIVLILEFSILNKTLIRLI